MKRTLPHLFAATLLIAGACSSPKPLVHDYYSHKTECISLELDGSQVLRAWTNPTDQANAIETAKKNAVRDVLFGGIYEGKSVCEKAPVVGGANPQAEHEDYFVKFFSDGGDYRKFAFLNDRTVERKYGKDEKITDESLKSGFIITVKRRELKQKMIADGIIN